MTPLPQTPLHHRANLDLLELMPEAPRVVEVGCSSGALAAAYKQRFPQSRYTGIEIDHDYAEVARHHCDEVMVADLEGLIHGIESKELMGECWVFGDCLEHFVDPWSVLRWVYEHQPADGVICACIPNAQHWSLQARLSCGAFHYQDSGLLDRTHLRFFTAATLPQLFEQAGYQIIEWRARVLTSTPPPEVLIAIRSLAEASGGNSDEAYKSALPFQYVVMAKKTNQKPPRNML